MKSYIDVPRHYWLPESAHHHECKLFYDNLISALLKKDCDVILSGFRAVINNGLVVDADDGISYAYHSKAPGRNTYCVKGGALPGLWYVDRDGYSGWSQIANDVVLQQAGLTFDLARAERAIDFYRNKFFEENFSKYPQSDEPLGGMVDAFGQYVFYPLQVNTDEVMKLSLFSQVEVIRRLSIQAERSGVHLVLKRHPKCTSPHIHEEMLSAARSDHVHVSGGSVHQLIASSRAVVISNSGVGQEALIHGKPVYSFARSEYAHMTTAVQTLDDLAQAFGSQPSAQPEPVTRQLGYLLCEYFVDGHDPNSVARRVEATVSEFRARIDGGPDVVTIESRLAGRSSVLHAIDLMLYDSVDYMLSVYQHMPDEAQERMSVLLARAARRGPQRERILRNADERTFVKYIAQCLREEDVAEAEARARQAVERFKSSQSMVALAKALLKKGDKIGGMLFAEKAAGAADATAEALFFLGRERLGAKPDQAKLALDYARKAIAIDANFALAHWLKARAHFLLSQPEPALAAANRAIELAPNNPGLTKIRDLILDRFGPRDIAHVRVGASGAAIAASSK